MTIKIGIIGLGVMGADHANIISSKIANATISEVYDSNVKHAHKIAKLVGSPKVKNSAFEVINSPDVDAIIIVSPDEYHGVNKVSMRIDRASLRSLDHSNCYNYCYYYCC